MARTIDRSGRTPLYYQIHEILLSDIESGRLRPGDRLPSETELTERFAVSRVTVKHAIENLVHDGLIYRIQGKGTFVAQPPMPKRLAGVASFSEELRQKGRTPSTQLLEAQVTVPDERVRAAMAVEKRTRLISLRRLRLADGEVMGLQTAYLPFNLCPDLADPRVIDGRSLYEVLEERYGLRVTRVLEEYRIVSLSAAAGRLLKQAAGSPVFEVKRWGYLPDGQLLEYVESLLRSDRYTLQIELGEVR